jgi:peptidoglycan/LPS O-acetylase OafA/YrhL
MLAAVPLVPIAWKQLWPYYAFFAQNFPVAFGWIPPNVLDPLWSLGVENQFYLVWPLVVFFLPRKWLAPSMVAVLVGEPVLRLLATPWFPTAGPIYALTPFRLDALATGAFLALALPRLQQRGVRLARLWSPVVAVAATLVIVWCTHHYPWFRRTANVATFNSVAYSLNLVALGACFVAAYYSRGWFARVLSSRPLAHMGRISYMFYLSHLFFMYYAGVLIHRHVVSVAVAFAATTAFASATWVLVERPILHWGRSRPAVPQGEAATQESFPLAA